MPWFASPFILHLAILTCLNTVIVSGLALVSRCGQLSLGHAAFVAIGAYVSVLAGQHWQLSFLPATVLGALAAGAVALALGWVILRLRGVYFVLVTFAFGELLRLALLDGAALTGGANGIAGIAPAEILAMRSTAVAATTAWRWARRCCPPGRWARCSGARWDTPSTRWRTTPRWPSPPG